LCVQVGNVYSATLYLALCGLIYSAKMESSKRVGLYSYGSGCSSEFYSGIITPRSKYVLGEMKINEMFQRRYKLSFDEYDSILDANMEWMFGIKDKTVDLSGFEHIYDHFFKGKGYLVLKKVNNYHREYSWS